jgi:hypothetical protein
MSTIAAGTTSGTALVSTGNTDGTIQLQVNGTTPSVTLAANGAIGVGSSPGYGTNGQVLTSAGTGSAPTWAAPATGAMALLATGTASNSATLDFTGISSTYDLYFIEVVEIVGASASYLRMLTSSNNGSSYDSSGYTYQSFGYTSNSGTWTSDFDAAATWLQFWNNNCNNISTTASNSGLSATAYLMSPASSAYTKFQAQAVWFSSSSANSYANITGGRMSTSPVNAIRFLMASGNIASGKIRLYGIANS